LPYVQSGRLRALAFTGSRRLSLMPEVPTVAESGLPDYIVDFTWNGWFAPAATPPAIVVRLQREIQQAVAAPPLRDLLQRAGFAAVADSPAAFDIFVKAELQRYAAVVREARIRAE
jgi:tripartite-type tricarboxylate transporter receptor subunit TctC